MNVKEIINMMLEIALAEVGYLEKRNGSNINDKKANAGYNNWTKYWADVKPEWQGEPWCACFISSVFKKAFGLDTAKKLLKHWPYVYCPTMAGLFTLHANPEVGDIVIFKRNGIFVHTGIVISVNGDYFETVEGNTSSAKEIEPNGGGVFKKGYYNSSLPGTKFCRPDYSIVATVNKPVEEKPAAPSPTSTIFSKETQWAGTVTAFSLNVRTWPGIENPTCSFSPLAKGVEVDVCDSAKASDGDTWYYIRHNDKYGFVHSDYIERETELKTDETKGFVGEVTASSLNVRTWAGVTFKPIVSYPQLVKCNRIQVLSTLKDDHDEDWYKICINNSITKNKDIIGFVKAEYIKKV